MSDYTHDILEKHERRRRISRAPVGVEGEHIWEVSQ